MSIKRLLALSLLGLMMLALWLSIGQDNRIYQYALLAPKMEAAQPDEQKAPSGEGQEGEQDGEQSAQADPAQEPPKLTALETLIKSLRDKMGDLATAQDGYSLTALAPAIQFGDGGQGQATAALKGLWGDQSLQQQDVLIAGRQLYYEELELGTPSAVIDERLAVAVFRVGDPLGRSIMIEGKPFTIVGILRHSRSVGEQMLYSARVPLLAMDRLGIQAQVLVAGVLPRAGAGAYAALSQGLNQWQAGGTFHSLSKEAYRARLPLRLLLCFVGLMTVSLMLKLSRLYTIRLWQGGVDRLQSRYALRMMPEFAGRFILVALMYAAVLAVLYVTLQALITPVYVFPEWVPVVLVEPKEISRTFWLLREQETAWLSLRTPEVLRLQYLHRLMILCCALAAALLLKPRSALRERIRQLA